MGNFIIHVKTAALGVLATLVTTVSAQAVVLGQYTFEGVGNVSASGVVPGISFSDVTAVNVTASAFGTALVTGDGKGNGPRWSAGDYIQFTITPAANRLVQLNSVTFDVSSSATFSGAYVQFDSGNGFSTAGSGIFSVDPAGSSHSVAFNMEPGSGSISVRFFGGPNNVNNRTITFDQITIEGELSVDGDVTPVPEPANIALAIFGCAFGGIGLGRKFLKTRAARTKKLAS